MLGYVYSKPRKRRDEQWELRGIPADLRGRLRPWVDVDEVGAEGFWLWLRAVVPLLPRPEESAKRPPIFRLSNKGDVEALERRLVIYAREQSRLTVIGHQCRRDNEVLTRRLKALEAALRTLQLAGHRVDVPADDDATDAAARYREPYRAPRRPATRPPP